MGTRDWEPGTSVEGLDDLWVATSSSALTNRKLSH